MRVWLAAGVHELLGAFLESALQGIYDLEARQRKGEEKLAQSEAHAKQNAEEIASLRLKLKTQAGEAMNAKHEMELLAQEVASVDQWQRKMQALKVTSSSDLHSSFPLPLCVIPPLSFLPVLLINVGRVSFR